MPNPRSVLKDAIDELPDDWKMKSSGVSNFLKKKQVKDEELEFSGMNKKILEAGKDRLTKQDLQAFEANRDDLFGDAVPTTGHRGTTVKGTDSQSYQENVRRFRSATDEAEVLQYDPRTDGSKVVTQPAKRNVRSHYRESDTYDYMWHTRSDEALIDGIPTRRVQELQSDLHQRGRRFGYDEADDTGTPGKTPFKKNWSTKALEQEILKASDTGKQAIAVPLEGPGTDRLIRAQGVKDWYATKVRSSMKKLAKKIGGKYKEVGGGNKPIVRPNAVRMDIEQAEQRLGEELFEGNPNLTNDQNNELISLADNQINYWRQEHGETIGMEEAIDKALDDLTWELQRTGLDNFEANYPHLAQLFYKEEKLTIDTADELATALDPENFTNVLNRSTSQFNETVTPQRRQLLDAYKKAKRKQGMSDHDIDPESLREWAEKMPPHRLLEEVPAFFGKNKVNQQQVRGIYNEVLNSPNQTDAMKAEIEKLYAHIDANMPASSTPETDRLLAEFDDDADRLKEAALGKLQQMHNNTFFWKDYPELQKLRFQRRAGVIEPEIDKDQITYGQIVMPEGEDWKKKLTLYSATGAVGVGAATSGEEAVAMPSVEEVQESLDYMMNEAGISRTEATQILNEELAEDIQQLKAEGYTDKEIQEVYGELLTLPEPTLLEGTTPDGPRTLVELGSREQPVNEMTTQMLNSLTAAAENVREEYMPLFGEGKAMWDENMIMKEHYRQREEAITYDIANTLRGHGYDIRINHDTGDLEWHEDGEVHPVDPGIWDHIQAMELELAGAVAGGAASAKAASKLIPGNAPILGKLAKGGIILGGILTGATTGRMADGAKNAWFTRQHLKNNYYDRRFKDSIVGGATFEILGGAAFEMGRFGLKGIGWAYDLFAKGNREGALQALKEQRNLSDEQIDEVIKLWEDSIDVDVSDMHRTDKAIEAVMMTQPGSQAWVGAAGGLNSKMSAAVQAEIDHRAKYILEASGKMTHDNVGAVLYDELRLYKQSVKDYFKGIKSIGKDSMADSTYKFDYDKLAINPLIDSIDKSITNPAVQERFLKLSTKIRDIGSPDGPRDFNALLDLRASVNDFFYNTKIRKAADYKALNSVKAKIDNEIKRAAQHMPNGEQWLKEWGKANVEYGKMKTVKKNALYKALTRPGVTPKKVIAALKGNIDSIDGTFMEVVGKLPPRSRHQAEGAVMDALAQKYTVGDKAGFQALDYPAFAEELRHIGFSNPEARKLKRAVTQMSEIFRNDVHLAAATGHVSKPAFQSYLTTDPVVRAKFEAASHFFAAIKKYSPTQKGREVALINRMSKILENPKSAKEVEALMREFPEDTGMRDAIQRLAVTAARFGEPESYPYIEVYRLGTVDSHKSRQGSLGKGLYWSTNKDAVNDAAVRTGAKTVKHKILPGRVATQEDIELIMGDVPFEELKDNPKFIEALKGRGFNGINIGDDVLIFRE